MSVRIDAAVPVPDQHGQFWLLYGNKYVRIHLAGGEPHSAGYWRCWSAWAAPSATACASCRR
ncbi:hypothetical protein GKJPGBOP_00197 [Streptomyces paromomycinus]|uniref:Uncharacterized protein n=1 Tax=Streptomyces paromomycinus TaxID=92743 RepID=A0A401VTY7_STREY|nr:hypothetical protein GKJPGBOP_00197 [Streptomyces paromomycinus]